jgi:transcriptional regulator GlxA family with amidase domain
VASGKFIDRPVPEPELASTDEVRSWALDHLAEPLTLGELAGRAGMSVRTFTRRFREEVGMSPNRWLTQQRVDHARRMLEATDLAVDVVATEVGFGTGDSLRQHFARSVGVSPSAYRRTFRVEARTA